MEPMKKDNFDKSKRPRTVTDQTRRLKADVTASAEELSQLRGVYCVRTKGRWLNLEHDMEPTVIALGDRNARSA